MRRHGQGQHYHQGGNAYGDQMRHVSSSQRTDYPKSSGGGYQRRGEHGSERGREFGNARDEEQWRSERDGSNVTDPRMITEVHRDGLDKSVYHEHRSGFQSSYGDERHPSYQPRQEDLDIPYADDLLSRGFDSIENKFLDEIMKLVKEQKDAEDAEYARHKEKLDSINVQYQEQLTTLRANQASRRELILQSESNARQQQYQQAMADQYSNHSMPSNNPHSYPEASPTSAASRYPRRQQRNATSTSNHKDRESYRYNQRGHFSSGPDDHRGAGPQNNYHSGRMYDNNRGFY